MALARRESNWATIVGRLIFAHKRAPSVGPAWFQVLRRMRALIRSLMLGLRHRSRNASTGAHKETGAPSRTIARTGIIVVLKSAASRMVPWVTNAMQIAHAKKT